MADRRHNTPDETDPAPKPRGGSLRSAMGPLLADPFRLVLVLAVNAAIVVGVVATALILRNHKPPPKPATMDAALAALDRGNADEARRMAERLAAKHDITNEEWGTPDYILGVLAANAAEAVAGKQRAELFLTAALYLQRSRERGFPASREAAGMYLLGKSLALCGRLDDALPVLEDALRTPAGHESELRGMLIEALLGVNPPEFDKALVQNEKLLADPQLDSDVKAEAMLQRAQILIRTNRLREGAAALDKVSDNLLLRGQVSLLRGRLALGEGQALTKTDKTTKEASANAKAKFRTAIDWFRKAINQDLGDNRVARQANYLIGICLAEQGDLPAALTQLERTAKLYPESPEFMAAMFQQGQIAGRLGRHSESVSAYQRLLAAYGRLAEFHNPWISVPELQASIQGTCRNYLKSEKYQTALLLSRALIHLIPRADALQLTAEIYRTWGDNLMEEAEHLPSERAEPRRQEARAQLRHAGDSYTEVAREVFSTRRYPEELWNGASAYFAGHDFRNAARMFRLYIHNEARFRNAQALVDLGEAELSLGEIGPALRTLQECIQQHPRDVAVYRARMLASRAAIAQGDQKQAETFLLDNLNGEQLTPASKEWRDSLFALGDLLHVAGRDSEAIPRLEEALNRYPDAPQAITARYLLADSSRRLALALDAGSAKEVSSAVRSSRRTESNRHLRQALEIYTRLQNELSRRDAEELTEQDKAVLRNARFALGDVYFQLQRYPEALRAYQSAANHYATSPVVLDAYLQIANVYRRMDRPAEARTSLEQARIALRRIPPEARFDRTTNFNRKQWDDLLNRLCSL